MPERVISLGDCLTAFVLRDDGLNLWRRDLVGAEMNFLIGCSRLGLATGLISSLSNDTFGKEILARLRKENIDVSQITYSKLPTALVFRKLHNGVSKILGYYRHGTAGSLGLSNEIDETYIAMASHLHFTGIFPALSETNRKTLNRLLRLAKRHQLCISFDANIRNALFKSDDEARQLLLPYIRSCDIFLSGLKEAQLLLRIEDPDDIRARLKHIGVQDLVIKMGEEGCWGYSEQEQWVEEAPRIKVVDPTGAGDAFNAGYIYAQRQGWSLKKKLSFASFMGGRVAASASDNQDLPDLKEAMKGIREPFIK